MSEREDRAAAEFALTRRVQRVVAEARSYLTSSLAAQHLGDDGEPWLRRCYATLEQLGPRERVYAIVVAMSGVADIDARQLIEASSAALDFGGPAGVGR